MGLVRIGQGRLGLVRVGPLRAAALRALVPGHPLRDARVLREEDLQSWLARTLGSSKAKSKSLSPPPTRPHVLQSDDAHSDSVP